MQGLLFTQSIFKLRTETYTYTSGLLTDSLTHSFVCIMLLKLGKGGKNILLPNSYKVSGSKSPDKRSLEANT